MSDQTFQTTTPDEATHINISEDYGPELPASFADYENLTNDEVITEDEDGIYVDDELVAIPEDVYRQMQ